VADLERTIRDLEGKAADLDRQLRAEEDHVRIKDPKHFAYSSFAHSARMRRDRGGGGSGSLPDSPVAAPLEPYRSSCFFGSVGICAREPGLPAAGSVGWVGAGDLIFRHRAVTAKTGFLRESYAGGEAKGNGCRHGKL